VLFPKILVSGRILLIVVNSENERAAFNDCLRATVHRSMFALSISDAVTRFVEVRPDLVLLPLFDAEDPASQGIAPIAEAIKKMRAEPCGSGLPVVLFDSSSTPLSDARKILKTLSASAFLPWPPRQDQIVRAIQVLTNEQSTDGALPPPPEESTAEITIERSDALLIDPLLAALALDEESDEIETNPRQALMEASVPASPDTEAAPVETTRNQGILNSSSPPAKAVQSTEQGTNEAIPVFRAPSGIEPTPVKFVRAYNLDPLEAEEPISESQRSIPEFMLEPELPSRETGQYVASDTAQKRIAEIPRGGGEESVSFSEGRIAAPAASNDRQGAGRKGLDESRLGKRLLRRIDKTFDALDNLDYYELLGLDRDSDPKSIRDAYFSLSLEFHPDRFFLLTSGAMKEKIYAIYRRINEAYLVLNDSRRRERYDEGLQKPVALRRAVTNERGFSPTENAGAQPSLKIKAFTPQGEDFVRRAQAAFGEQDFDGARMYLTLALACEPNSEEISEGIKQVLKSRPQPNPVRRW
jgi:hypothetical protein